MPRQFVGSAYGTFTNWDSLVGATIVRPFLSVSINVGLGAVKDTTWLYPNVTSTTAKGYIQDISFPRDTINRERKSFTVVWTGLDSNILSQFLAAKQFQYTSGPNNYDIPTCTIKLWFIDSVDVADSQAAYTIATGLLDTCNITEANDSTTIEANFVASSDWTWDRPVEGRWTDNYQRSLVSLVDAPLNQSFSADKGFEFVERLQDWNLFWARRVGSGGRHKGTQGKKNTKKGTKAK